MIMKIVRIDMPLIRSRCLPWVQGAEAEKDNVTIVQILNSGKVVGPEKCLCLKARSRSGSTVTWNSRKIMPFTNLELELLD